MDEHLEAVTAAYLEKAQGDAGGALRLAVADLVALAVEAEQQAAALSQLVSHGYVRGRTSD